MKWLRRTWPYILLALLLLINALAWSQRQAIADWWVLRDYHAPQEVAALVEGSAMTAYAERLFYINRPSLESKKDFNKHCTDKTHETAVLGCYHGNRRGIYIYAVTDERLAGVREVTAAHEMLHQAYERLSETERKHIDGMLENYYQNGLNDASIKTKIEAYKKVPGSVLTNEMHSIFGTELRVLPPELETYYQRYFSDRNVVVTKREAYQEEFTRRQELVKQYDSRLGRLKNQIDGNEITLKREMEFLNAKEKEIDQTMRDGHQEQYQANVRVYNSTVVTYNALLTKTRNLINEYNDIVAKRNDIAVQEQQLQQALDSRLDPTSAKQ